MKLAKIKKEGSYLVFEKLYGHVETKQFHKIEDGRCVFYGYSIHRDRNGREVSRTEPSRLSAVGWGDGRPLTEKDLMKLRA